MASLSSGAVQRVCEDPNDNILCKKSRRALQEGKRTVCRQKGVSKVFEYTPLDITFGFITFG